ncbi:AGAP005427-PA-like protein [Anopheles sinensis]|uniref:Large ribosomal subunit protein eL28 n=1 Tax=Anopheles sinensis TaxID=74873 RepID=A0A084VD94_ANOSI|nr:AGAP005427-PA-like protein [Anopheles sinensis]
MVSSHLNWLIIRDHNSFLLKQKNIRKPFAKEPGNLTNLSSFRYSGLVHKKTLSITPAEKKGFNYCFKRPKLANKPAKTIKKVLVKTHARHALKKVSNMIKKHHYRRDLKQAALRRASAILRSQRPYNPKKGKAGTAPAAPAAAATAAAAAPKKAE